ncbi:MAG: OmpA family protein [Cyclobacteriaceae bacterium]|nr:OmpA family protein [Cyclobacteriaceae bacterium]
MTRLLSILFFAISIVHTSFSQEVNLERGLVSYYPFDENTNDVVGKNHGKNNGASLEDGRCGDMAYSFNGYLDYIDFGNDRSLNGNWNGLSLSVWVRPDEISELQLATIMAKWAFNTEKDHFGLWLNSSYKVIMAVSSPGTMENGVFSKSSLSYDTWHHIVATWRRNGEIRIYIDGKFDKIGKQTGKYINVRSPLSLKFGRQVNGRSRPYKGWLDEVRIYKRALYDKEVAVLYQQGKAICEKVYVKGRVLNKKTREPVQADVVFENMKDGSIYNKVKTSGPEAEYELILPLGSKFGFYADTENYLAENQNISTENRVLNEVIERDLYVVPLEVGQSIRLNNIFFDSSLATLREESFHELDRILPYFEKFPNLKIELSGHTDAVGSDAANQKLSEARASSVRDYLIKNGVMIDKIEAVGYGESEPVATNDTDEGRQLNRRVEFKVLEK